MLPVFLHIEATPNPSEADALKSYTHIAADVMRKHGGITIATYDVESAIDLASAPAMFKVISFPSRQAIQALFLDSAYKAIVPERNKGFSHIRFYVTSERI